jgi:hypothetical protein
MNRVPSGRVSEVEGPQLVGDHLDDFRYAVADAGDERSAATVDVAAALVIERVDAITPDRFQEGLLGVARDGTSAPLFRYTRGKRHSIGPVVRVR